MRTNTKLKDGYESPLIRVLIAEVEIGFMTSAGGGTDPKATGNDMPWGNNF